jgi:hypothetical protein
MADLRFNKAGDDERLTRVTAVSPQGKRWMELATGNLITDYVINPGGEANVEELIDRANLSLEDARYGEEEQARILDRITEFTDLAYSDGLCGLEDKLEFLNAVVLDHNTGEYIDYMVCRAVYEGAVIDIDMEQHPELYPGSMSPDERRDYQAELAEEQRQIDACREAPPAPDSDAFEHVAPLGSCVVGVDTMHTGGGCMVDVIRMKDGTIFTVTDDMLMHFKDLDEWDEHNDSDEAYATRSLVVEEDGYWRVPKAQLKAGDIQRALFDLTMAIESVIDHCRETGEWEHARECLDSHTSNIFGCRTRAREILGLGPKAIKERKPQIAPLPDEDKRPTCKPVVTPEKITCLDCDGTGVDHYKTCGTCQGEGDLFVPKVGDRVTVRPDGLVERYPHFTIDSGHGTVRYIDRDGIWVKMDDPIEGCEDWDNEIMFNNDDSAGAIGWFHREMEFLGEPGPRYRIDEYLEGQS